MKITILVCLCVLLTSLPCRAGKDKDIGALKKKLEMLESKVNALEKNDGLKVLDLSNTSVDEEHLSQEMFSGNNKPGESQLSKKQIKEIMQILEKFKEAKKKHDEQFRELNEELNIK